MEKIKSEKMVYKVFTVFAGAMLMGFLWRVRGETGWGSSWGLLNAGFVFTLFMILAKGERKKLDMGWLALTALSFMLTVPSWGTLLNQITGVLYEPEIWSVDDPYVYVPVWTAIVLMLSLGFGLATIFGIMLGRGYSDKKWKLKDFIILIAVFYAADIISKATISHFILDLIQPQTTEIFEKGLAAANVDGDVYKLYLQHFDDLSWGKKFDGGRNYFSSIQAISSVFRSAASLIATKFIIKDKIAAKTGAVVSVAFAFSITVSDLFFYFGNGGYHMQNPSYFTDFVYPWSCWEFFTGFIAGGIITVFMLSLKDTQNVSESAFSRVPEKAETVLRFILGSVFMLGVSIVRPVLERFDDSDFQIIATVIAVVVAIAFVALLSAKFGINMNRISLTKTAEILFPVFVLYIGIAYFFIGTEAEMNMFAVNKLHNILCIVSICTAFVWVGIRQKQLEK